MGLAALMPNLQAEKGVTKKELRFLDTAHGPEISKEPVTFLGIETSPVDPTLTEQLGLPKGVGLVVRSVVPDSPAINVLKPHDILTKLNDQLLIETRQLAVLIRMAKDGDEVTLTFVRGGKQSSAKVKLATREMPGVMGMVGPGGFIEHDHLMRIPGGPPSNLGFSLAEPVPPPGPPGQIRLFRVDPDKGGGADATALNVENSHLVFSDDQGSLELTTNHGRKSLVAKNQKGEKVFEGPVNSSEERNTLPPEIRGRLEKLENIDGISFEAGGQFGGSSSLPSPQNLARDRPVQRTFWLSQTL